MELSPGTFVHRTLKWARGHVAVAAGVAESPSAGARASPLTGGWSPGSGCCSGRGRQVGRRQHVCQDTRTPSPRSVGLCRGSQQSAAKGMTSEPQEQGPQLIRTVKSVWIHAPLSRSIISLKREKARKNSNQSQLKYKWNQPLTFTIGWERKEPSVHLPSQQGPGSV